MPWILVSAIVGHRFNLLFNLRSIVENLLECVIYLFVETDRRLFHPYVQRLQGWNPPHEAGEDLLAEWVVLIPSNQAVISELIRAAHHGSVLRNSRHGHVQNLAVLDQRSTSLHPLSLPEILLE